MVDWNKISSKRFENLAYIYVTSKYPEVNWESTKRTRDGNRDGEAIYSAPLNTTIKYWYEAKYSKTCDKCIPKSHLDSTLVSCLLDGKVVLLAFITNAYISEDYRRRADVFSKQRDNLKIIYINGDELEDWLCDNPEIENEFFATKVAKKRTTIDYVESACILQNYDMSGNQFAKARSIECGKEYILYLSFYSKHAQQNTVVSINNTIKLLNSENRKYDQYNCLYSKAGFNSFFLPIRILCKSEEPLKFIIMGENEIDFTAENIPILDIYNPKIIYRSQIEISNNMFSAIQDRDISNAIYYIIGDGGSGKTYLLNDLYHNSLTPFSSFVFAFTGDETHDCLNCYKLFIASLYGDIWNCYTDDKFFIQFNEIESSMIEQIVTNRVDEMSIDQIMQYYKNNSSQIERISSQTQIFIDDLHKLSSKVSSLLQSFFDWTINQRYNCKIFVFTRPESEPTVSYTKKLYIKGIEHEDVESTVICNFNRYPYLSKMIRKYPLPLNTLHFLNLLCKLHEVEQEFVNKTELETQILLNKIFSDSKKLTCLSLGNQIITKYKNNRIVYCIYKIKTGVSLDAINDFFGGDSQDEVFELCQQRILKESSNILFPYHDILVLSYESFSTNEMNKILERFVLFAENHNYISKAKMFSVLIKIGKQCFWKYRTAARVYRDELHASADYAQALEIAINLKEINQKSLDDYDLEDCKNQFVIANCIKYTESYEQANCEFTKLIDIYMHTHNSDFYGLYLESETEIINNLIWMLEVRSAKKRLTNLSLVFEDLYSRGQISGKNMIYAFLNYYNRLMFVNYMLDIGTEEQYQEALNYARELNQSQYVAFAKMDFAKCLYRKDLSQSAILIDEALDILSNCNEKRRFLDALSEKCFINDLVNRTISLDTYNEIKTKMHQHHYIQSEVKVKLKIVLLKLLYSKTNASEIRNMLDSVSINNSTIGTGKRHQAFVNHLYAATYYMENNLSLSRKYTLKCLGLMKSMGDSYQCIHRNNAGLEKYNGFLSLNEVSNTEKPIDTFILDIRIW